MTDALREEILALIRDRRLGRWHSAEIADALMPIIEKHRPRLEEAWAALRLIRDTIEEIGPIGALPHDERFGGFMAEAEAISQAIVKMAEPDWRPIASAPRDGTLILIGHKHAVFAGWWEELYSGWVDGDSALCGRPITYEPTHWMPLPTAPLPVQQGDGG